MTAMISLLYNVVYTGSAAAALPMLVYYFLPYAATNALLFFGTAINIAIQLQNFDTWYEGKTYADFPFWVPHLICIALNVAADRRNARREDRCC
ncbi:hypothetical protein K4F52_000449 [Lecanicillium sp. MT-2017a]|nr:hypothetical protein K4F52_000449 [Lecanicillium sp. MT-2017a]